MTIGLMKWHRSDNNIKNVVEEFSLKYEANIYGAPSENKYLLAKY